MGTTSRSTRGCSARRASALPAGLAPGPAAPRLRRATRRAPAGSAPVPYDDAIGRVAERDRADPGDPRARRLRRPRRSEHDDREALPDGQVRADLPADREHRLQRPPLHGLAPAAGNKKAFGIDRAANPMVRHPAARRSSGSAAPTSPSARRSPRTTSGRRENGARVIDGRPAHHAPRAHRATSFLPIKPGRDVALFNGVLHLMIENDWLDHDFIEQPHRRLRRRRPSAVREWTPRRTAEVTGIAERSIRQAAEWWGTAKTSFLMHARGIEHHSPRRAERARGDQHRARLGPDRPAGLRLRDDHRPGQRPGRPRARPEVRPAPRRAGHRRTPSSARHVAGVWGIRQDELPHAGRRLPTRSSARSSRGEIRGLLVRSFQPGGLPPGQHTSSGGCWRSWTSTSPSTSS